MKKILSYSEFNELVPNDVVNYVGNFLRWANNDKIYIYEKYMENTHALARHSLMFLDFMSKNGIIIKSILSNSGYPDNGIFKIDNTNNPTKEKLFSLYADFFCLFDEDYKYTTLNTFRLVYYACKNLVDYNIAEVIQMKYHGDIFYDSIINKYTISGTNKIWETSSSFLNERATDLENEDIDNISQKLYKNISVETISFLDTVSVFFACLTKECNVDLGSAKTKAILGAIYRSEQTKSLKEQLISKGLLFDEIFKNENITLGCLKHETFEAVLLSSSKDIRIINYYFKKYLKTDESCKIYDVLEKMFDRKLGNGIMIEQLLLSYGITKDDFLKIAKQALYSETALIEVKKKLYKDNSKQVIDYINYIASIYPSVAGINNEKIFNYSDEELVAITVFLNILKTDSKGSMNYFKKLGITLEDVLNYFQIKVEEQNPALSLEIVYSVIERAKKEKKEERITEIEGNLIDLGNLRNVFLSKEDREFMEKYNEMSNVNPDFIELKFMSLYGNLYKEIMCKINPSISFKEVLTVSFREYLENILKGEEDRENNKKIRIALSFYKDLPKETLDYLSYAYTWRKLIRDKFKTKFNDDEITALSLFTAFDGKRLYVNDFYLKYFYEEMMSKHLVYNLLKNNNKLGYPNFNDDTHINYIDEIKNLYEKFIFDGVNKDKKSNEIKMIDVFKNMLNNEVYDTTILYEFLKPHGFFDTTKLEEVVMEHLKKYCHNELNVANITELENNSKYIIGLNAYIYYLNSASMETKKIIENIGLNNYIKLICIFYRNCYEKEVFDKYGVMLEDYLKYIKINETDFKTKMEEHNFDEQKYIHLYNLLQMSHVFDESKLLPTKFLMKNYETDIYNAIKYELENNKPYVRELTKEEKLEAFSLSKIEVIDVTDVKNMRSFGSNLSITSSEIVSEFTSFNMSDEAKDEKGMDLINIVNSLNSKQENKRSLLDIFRKKEEKNTMLTKDILEKINAYLNSKEVTLEERIKKLEYIKKAMRIYLIKAKEYLDSANTAYNEFKDGIKDKNYGEYDLSVFDDATKKQVLEDKVTMLTSSITMMLQQYEKVVMQLNTHDALVNQIKLFKMTTLQNLYVELSLHEGIRVESETIGAMNTILNLLNDLSVSSSQSIISHISEINNLEVNNSKLSIDEHNLYMLDKITSEDEKRNVKK